MTLSIELPPEMERRLEQEAARRGQAPAEHARAVIEEKLTSVASAAENPIYAGLLRRDPHELIELAHQQGAATAIRFEDLMSANFWPEDESADEFMRTIREWRREGHSGEAQG